MHFIDLAIFGSYTLVMLGVGVYFYFQNTGSEDYYVGGRDMNAFHIGLSVTATDVGGGFSIGLGGLGFTMGLSGSWMLFTGLMGAWLASVLLIPKVKSNPVFAKALTFPDILRHYFNGNVALLAGLISAIGYLGFTSSQILAGAKLASGTFIGVSTNQALIFMGAFTILYTVLGGIKAVIYTDTIQWSILLIGLIFVATPFAYFEVGGWQQIQATVSPEMLSLTNLTWQDAVNWTATIMPIWFIAMTLYQRIFAARDEKTAKRAWYIAGLFEWPIMAFMGVFLGLLARVAADQGMFDYLGAENISATDAETGLPMLLRSVLPAGAMGLVLAAYFSAILSTADSCLMAGSGNVVSDLIERFRSKKLGEKAFLRFSQITTLVLGIVALLLATSMTSVLDMMLYSYGFMVSGLLVPVLGAILFNHQNAQAAFASMLVGGTTTVGLQIWTSTLPLGLDANVFGITCSALVYLFMRRFFPQESST